jgi:hypothetical protein
MLERDPLIGRYLSKAQLQGCLDASVHTGMAERRARAFAAKLKERGAAAAPRHDYVRDLGIKL